MRVKYALPVLALSLLAAGAQAQEAAPGQAGPGDTVLIVGQRPGPGLWKVSHGDHVMYVFGKYGPLPKNMQWRSHEVEAILAKSQEYLAEPAAHAGVGVWSGLKLAANLPRLWGLQDNPDGKKLQDVVPAETYARWLALKEKYIGKHDGIESRRPLFAAGILYSSGLERAGLSEKDQVGEAMGKLVKQSNVKYTASTYRTEMSDPGGVLKEFKRSGLEDAECFAATLAKLETDIDHMRTRANAWAIGDIETIRKLNFGDRDSACRSAMESSAAFKSRPELAGMREHMRAIWLTNAEKALASNSTTFAVLRMDDILSPTGLLAALQAKGYAVEAPE